MADKQHDSRLRFSGTSPSGRRFYVTSKTGTPLVFAVFMQHKQSEAATRHPVGTWERVQVIEDRIYPNEKFRESGSYVHSMDMDPRRKAEEVAIWYREVLRCEAVVIPLSPIRTKVSTCA